MIISPRRGARKKITIRHGHIFLRLGLRDNVPEGPDAVLFSLGLHGEVDRVNRWRADLR
jgi:hypothetical protein